MPLQVYYIIYTTIYSLDWSYVSHRGYNQPKRSIQTKGYGEVATGGALVGSKCDSES